MPPDRVIEAIRGCARPTCAYVYDTATLHEQADALRAILPDRTRLLYAVKANGHPGVLAALLERVDGVEVASIGELRLANGAPLIAFSGPAKTDEELAAAVAAGALVHVESAHELRRRATLGPGRIALRVNRIGTRLLGTHAMTGVPTPFGVDETELGDVCALARTAPHLDLVGFHLHAVSNNLDGVAHGDFVAESVAWAVAAAHEHGVALRYVNVGGGIGVDYTEGRDFDLGGLADGLRRAEALLPGPARLVLEPGRFLAARAGWYAAEVLDLKRTHGRWFAVLRGGTHHFRLPAAWGYSHPFTVLPVDEWVHAFPRPEVRRVAVDAVGELCTPRDVLARDHVVDRLRVGDVLVFGQTGAYGWDISHHEFLRHPYPELILT